MYADPAQIHPIHHVGKYYDVAGPHLAEPLPQRTPLLFQAGSSSRGRDFAAKHAECVFIVASRQSLRGAASVIDDIRTRAAHRGRYPGDIRFFQGLSPVVGGTETAAKTKAAEYLEQFSTAAALAHLSGSLGVAMDAIDLRPTVADL